MKFYNFLIALCALFLVVSCDEEEDIDTSGTVTLTIDNVFGDSDILFVEDGSSSTYNLTNGFNQEFNVDLMGYYISQIQLTGMEGTADYADEISISADEALGFYLIVEKVDGVTRSEIVLNNVPEGSYSNLKFTLGVDLDLVQEGVQGGDLDPARGYFWNWDNGYIGYKLEGTVAEGEEGSDEAYEYHIGGEGEGFSNIKSIDLTLNTNIVISSGSNSTVMLESDALKAMSGSSVEVDFTTMSSGHAPSDTQLIANNLTSAFEIISVENDTDN